MIVVKAIVSDAAVLLTPMTGRATFVQAAACVTKYVAAEYPLKNSLWSDVLLQQVSKALAPFFTTPTDEVGA